MLKIICLSDYRNEVRQIMILAEGFIQHPEVDVTLNEDYVSLGTTIKRGVRKEELNEALLSCDIITMPNCRHFGDPPSKKARPYPEDMYKPFDIRLFIDENKLWHKVVYCDVRDESFIDEDFLNKCLAYFKRTRFHWNMSKDSIHGTYVPMETKKSIYPLPISVLDAYLDIHHMYNGKPLDLGYYYNPERLQAYGNHYSKRIAVWNALAEVDWSKYIVKLGHSWPNYNAWDPPIFWPPIEVGGAWIEYMRWLNQSKIILDALPTRYYQTHRPWEAMSSGSMCFLDKEIEQVPNHLEHEKHCYYYDASDDKSIKEVLEVIKYYLEHDKERITIAEAGFEHIKKYHRAINRVDSMLKTVKDLL